ncbi:MAG: MBOAT family O-acyltransferase [Clostridia bacterium]
MLFSSVPFLYWFLPIILLLYFVVPKKGKNLVLLLASLSFYYYGEPKYMYVMLGSTFCAFIFGLIIDKAKRKKIPMVISLSISLAFLLVFKYTDFFIGNLQGLGFEIAFLKLALPIGISFYTFQAMSYTVDLYKGQAKVQTNIINFACYISFFPQLIAGPIVRYTTIEDQLKNRVHSIEKFSDGAFRFTVGLGKKVLIANVLGEFCEKYTSSNEQTALFAWGWAIAYSMQIYFDFSGYSDMAIGLGKIFGFDFPENFDYPFISTSITEFWRRWHMSLGSWFRDYVYIPLGGNRVKLARWIFNIAVVWFLTGFWHGASWNFILWGLYFAVFLVLEKFIKLKTPNFIKHVYLVLFVVISFVIFASTDTNTLISNFSMLFSFDNLINKETLYYMQSYLYIFVIGFIGVTPLVKNIAKKGGKIQTVLQPISMVLILILVTAFLVKGSFNPFLYFRF